MQVIAHVKIYELNETEPWFFNACTSCDCPIEMTNGNFYCDLCARIVPHAEKRYCFFKSSYNYVMVVYSNLINVMAVYYNFMMVHSNFRFRLHVVAYDQTGKLDVILSDREVYSLIGCRARDVIPEVKFLLPVS